MTEHNDDRSNFDDAHPLANQMDEVRRQDQAAGRYGWDDPFETVVPDVD